MEIKGLVNSTQVVDQLEAALRDPKHRVEGRGRQQDAKNAAYPWQFSSAVIAETKPAAKAKPTAVGQRRPVTTLDRSATTKGR